jgi:hypothetical protein
VFSIVCINHPEIDLSQRLSRRSPRARPGTGASFAAAASAVIRRVGAGSDPCQPSGAGTAPGARAENFPGNSVGGSKALIPAEVQPADTHSEAGAKGGRGKKASDNITSFRGNAPTYALRRLKRDRRGRGAAGR